MLSRYAKSLTGLTLQRSLTEAPVPDFEELCPARSEFLRLESFGMFVPDDIPSARVPYIISMISAPPQVLTSLLTSRPWSRNKRQAWRSLVQLQLQYVRFQPVDWRVVIEAIDFSRLKELYLCFSSISVEEFRTLADRVPEYGSSGNVPLRVLDVRKSALTATADVGALRELVMRLKSKVPLVKIQGIREDILD
ncbi:hypothetical protein EDD21DRAFT_352971 [Dissophora ornata]|nr:hypothetical protein EDD21DRAFT_352971 [Dissophora ornata]